MFSVRPLSGYLEHFLPMRWHAALLIACFVLIVHNYGITLLPPERIVMDAAKIRPSSEPGFGYTYGYSASFADVESSQMSRVRLTEDGRVLQPRLRIPAEVYVVGGGRWSHFPGQLLFSTSDNSDPRTNQRRYVIESPILYNMWWGRFAILGFALGTAALYWRTRHLPRVEPPADPSRKVFLASAGLATIVLAVGVYCSSGTLSPFANTYPPHVDPATGYLYNNDHPHFQVLFDFVDGQDRSTWDGAIMLRRILFPALAWPFMKLWGFETGGFVASLAINVAVLLVTIRVVRREIGPRGAAFAGWMLALYPGISYWAALPYAYTLIVPLSFLLFFALRLLLQTHGRPFVLVSLGMGVAYLGYDLMPFFLPASWLLLVTARRWSGLVITTVLQLAPLALWLTALVHVFDQPLTNSNTRAYGVILSAYANISNASEWWAQIRQFPDVGANVFFASNFIFLPALFLGLIAINAMTSRVRLGPAEWALLLATVALFLFNNLVPPYGGWSMRGTWIARLYQPLVPVLVLFAARWWQHCPQSKGPVRTSRRLLITACVAGNALIVFGPLLHNPLRVSERAFYGFYNHTDAHFLYEHYLDHFGRRPLGFPMPVEP